MAQIVKIKLGARPKTFALPVTFDMIGEDGKQTKGSIEFTAKYKTRKELAALSDEFQATVRTQTEADIAAAKMKIEAGEDLPMPTNSELLDRELSINIDFILQVLEAWNLEDQKFGRPALEQLAVEIPAAIPATMDAYRAAINQGRLGN